MSKKSRTILFFILAFAFSIIAPSIVLYSEGYRFDFETGEILETGGFFIKTNPGETNIIVNDKKAYRTSNFSKSILIQNLTPKEYNVKINKDGYQSWEKNLGIFPKKVSEIDIVLFRNTYEKTLNLENVLDVYKTEKGFIIKKETGFYFYNLENNKEELITKNTNWDSIQI
ncbi:MAG: hypothetical protein PHY30_03880, partial [Candidatus Pacebacteria bacterium]|nr:hypothetical protein [Candidatus Paceibacterota bacterium]